MISFDMIYEDISKCAFASSLISNEYPWSIYNNLVLYVVINIVEETVINQHSQ